MSTLQSSPHGSFRHRFSSGERLIGTFVKTPTTHATEILGDLGFDFVVIDEEHAPFDRVTIDAVLLAARATGTAGIVGSRSRRPSDTGPRRGRQRRARSHVDSVRKARGDRRRLPLSRRQERVLQLARGRADMAGDPSGSTSTPPTPR